MTRRASPSAKRTTIGGFPASLTVLADMSCNAPVRRMHNTVRRRYCAVSARRNHRRTFLKRAAFSSELAADPQED